jgi:hypothetical protein
MSHCLVIGHCQLGGKTNNILDIPNEAPPEQLPVGWCSEHQVELVASKSHARRRLPGRGVQPDILNTNLELCTPAEGIALCIHRV